MRRRSRVRRGGWPGGAGEGDIVVSIIVATLIALWVLVVLLVALAPLLSGASGDVERA